MVLKQFGTLPAGAAPGQKFYKEIKKSIKSHGRFIFAEDDGVGPPFAYTIGNTEKGLPELLAIGVCGHNALALDHLSDIMVERGEPFQEGEVVDISKWCDDRYPTEFKVINTNAKARDEYTIRAGQYFGHEDYQVQQVLIPDRQGYFPGDPKCGRIVPVLTSPRLIH